MFSAAYRTVALLAILSFTASLAVGQNTTIEPVVPSFVKFSGTLADVNGKPGVVGVTFGLYQDPLGGAPLWVETQNVRTDGMGNYSVTLGSTAGQGLPPELFSSGQARWLGVRAQGQVEQPRVMLLAVPYALKAGDAQTIGGLPPSAFVLAAPPAANTRSLTAGADASSTAGSAPALSGGGTADFVPLWLDNSGTLGNSTLFQSGSGITAKVGIGTTAPTATLDVKGTSTIRGLLTLPATAKATATAGKNSEPFDLAASAFNATSKTPVNQTFQWLAEAVGNNTAGASGSLNLLFGQGAVKPVETGLHIASNGQIFFAPGQVFPGTGTISGITAGTDLTGGGSNGNVTLNLDITKVPQLNAGNTFIGNQTVTGSLAVSGPVTGVTINATSGFTMGGTLFAFGSTTLGNAFLGFSGNLTTTGIANTAVGIEALAANTTGQANVAVGGGALLTNTTGVDNTSVGWASQNANTTGYSNTSLGNQALGYNTTGSYNTASGFRALVLSTGSQNTADGANVLYNNTTGSENTGSGYLTLYNNTTGSENTAAGVTSLFNNTTGALNTAIGMDALTTNTTGLANTALGFGAGSPSDGNSTTGSNLTFVGAGANFGGPNEATLHDATAIGANAEVTASNALILGSINGVNNSASDTSVGIGTTAPIAKFSVSGNENTTNGFASAVSLSNTAPGGGNWYLRAGANGTRTPASGLTIANDIGYWMTITSGGAVGINTVTPDATLSVDGTADKPGGGSWGTYSDRRLKNLDGNFSSGLAEILKIKPVRYRYKDENAMGIQDREEHVGLVAQDVQKVIPEAVTENKKGYLLVNNDPIIWTMLNAIKEQQRLIRQQQAQIARLSSQVKAIRVSLKTGGQPRPEVRAVKTQVAMAR